MKLRPPGRDETAVAISRRMMHTRPIMRPWLLPILVAMPLVLIASASASEAGVPTCTAADRDSRQLVHRDGYSLACNPGSAVVKFKGITYRMKGSRCFISSTGARLYFGAQRFNSPLPPPLNSLYLVVEPNRDGA